MEKGGVSNSYRKAHKKYWKELAKYDKLSLSDRRNGGYLTYEELRASFNEVKSIEKSIRAYRNGN